MRYLLGPGLIWLLIYGAANLVAKANVPPTKSLDKFIENSWFWLPLLVLLTFALWWVPVIEKRWLLLRVWIACITGGHFALEKIMMAYSQQGPGIGMAYIMGIGLLFFLLIAGSIFIKIKF